MGWLWVKQHVWIPINHFYLDNRKNFHLNLEVSSQESAGFPLFWREWNFKTCRIFWNLRKLHLCFGNFPFYPLTFLPNFMRILYIHNYSHDLCCTVLYGYSCYMGKILPLQNLAADIAPIWNILGTTPSLRHFSILAEDSKCGFLSVKQHQN